MLRIENQTGLRYRGWVSTTTPRLPSPMNGTIGGHPFVVQEPIGAVGNRIDVFVDIPAGGTIEGPMLYGSAIEPPALPEPPHALLCVGGVPLQFIGAEGKRWHLRARMTPMLVADLWVDHVGQAWNPFELLITASNPSIPDMTATVPENFALTAAGAVVSFLHGGYGTILPAGETFGDGQSRSFIGTIAWMDRLQDPVDQASAYAWSTGGILAVDLDWIDWLGPLRKTAQAPPRWSGSGWVRATYSQALRALGSWAPTGLGISARATDTGAQADQGYGGKGTALAQGGGAAVAQVLRFIGMDAAKRPCHHREKGGEQLDLNGHPRVAFWQGRPHWHTGVSPDQLGKPRGLMESEAHGWWGDEREHLFQNTMGAAYQLTGSALLHELWMARSRWFLFGETVDPSLSTSGADASRSRGWAGIYACWLWLCLKDRTLADAIKQRFLKRVDIYMTDTRPIWDTRQTEHYQGDPSKPLIGVSAEVWSDTANPTPFPAFVLSYQAGFGAGALHIAGEFFDWPHLRQFAFAQCKSVMERSFKQRPDGSWELWESLGVKPDGTTLPPAEFVEGRGAHKSGIDFTSTWMAPAIRAVLLNEPENEQARAIWQQIQATGLRGRDPLDWVPPLTTVTP